MLQKKKEDVVELLEAIAQLLELKGENTFKIRAYTNGARTLETYSGDFSALILQDEIQSLAGIGDALRGKILEYATTGKCEYYETLRGEFPETLFELFELQGLGPKKIRILWDELGITKVSELETACKDGRVASLKGFGAKTATNLLVSIDAQKRYAGKFRFGTIAALAEHILQEIKDLDNVNQAAIAGSYRRRKEVVSDLDFIVATRTPEVVSNYFVNHPEVETVLAHGPTKSSVRLKIGIQADLRVVSNEQYPFALLYFTGSKEHNVAIRSRALDRGWTLNEYRLGIDDRANQSAPIPNAIHTEKDIYTALHLDYIEPELREDRGEVAAADEHKLPRLVELENIRGAFHNHTTSSDGQSSLEDMVTGAIDLGLEYLGISDHSISSVQAHGLTAERLLQQVEQIRELNKKYAPDFKIFTGVECDILRDGTLDYPDEVLSKLDYVVASVHASFSLSESEMTQRIVRAMENPHVTMLGHVSGRLLLSREAYQIDVHKIIDAAAATGTIIELNANPYRLDLDWRWWPLAKSRGVRCSINPDAHHVSHFQFLWNGVGIARKGWLERKDVINTLPLGKIEDVLRQKRKAAGIQNPLPL